jgi:ribose transport system permease protein
MNFFKRRKKGIIAILDIREFSILLAAIVLFIVLSVASPYFLTLENLLLVARQISILAILATGMTFLFIAKEIDLSVGSIYGFLAIILAYLIARVAVNPWIALAIIVFLGALIGLVNGIFTTVFRMPSFIVTLGMLSILRGGALLISGAWPINVYLPINHPFPMITSGKLGGIVPTQIFWMIAIIAIASFVLSKTRFGAHVYSTGGNEEAAKLTGISVRRVKIISFMVTGALCAIGAGLLVGQVGSAFPLAGQGFELNVIAAVVIGGTQLFGGRGTIVGTLIGAAIMGMISNGLVLLGVSSHLNPVAEGGIIILAVLLHTLTRRERS